jgi:transcriptional regulator with XRE-family HTH domain
MPSINKKRLREVREKRKITQTKIAKLLKVTHSTVHYWEREDERAKEPNIERVRQLCQILNVNIDYLYGMSDEETPPETNMKTETTTITAKNGKVVIVKNKDIKIPIYEKITTNVIEEEKISHYTFVEEGDYGIIQNDDLMFPTIPKDSILIVKKLSLVDVFNGEIVIVSEKYLEATARRLYLEKETQTITFMNDNQRIFASRSYPISKIDTEVFILGKVIEIRSKPTIA